MRASAFVLGLTCMRFGVALGLALGLTLGLTLGLAGCPPPPDIKLGDDAGPGGDVDAGPAGAVDASQYCESIVDFFCPFYVRCGRMAVADVDACKPVFLEACNARFEPRFVSLVNAGLLELTQSGIDACEAHLGDVECDQQILDLDGPCGTMWQGTEPAGGPCGLDIESLTCAPGTLCTLDLTFCGTCETVADDGADCSRTGVTCGHDSFCDATALTCKPRKKVGEACSGDDRCVLGAACDQLVCRGPSYVGVGDACDFSNQCPYASTCEASTCVATVELGEPCSVTAPLAPCDSGFCDVNTNPDAPTCTALVAQGGDCTDAAQCETGVCNDAKCSSLPSACFPP